VNHIVIGMVVVISAVLLASLSLVSGQGIDRNCFGDENSTLSDSFLAGPVDPASQAAVYAGERAFGVNLIKALFKKFETQKIQENIFISPSSIFHTLLLAYFGSEGETAEELELGLGLENLGKPEVLKTYMFDRAYQAVRERTPGLGYEFLHANKLYLEKGLNMNQCLQMALTDQVEGVDFSGSPEESREQMNSWVEDLTKGNIKDLIPAGYVDTTTKAAIVNAAYFKGDWMSQFKESDTKAGNFYVTRDEIRVVKFMNQKGSFNYYTSDELQAHVVELPYEGDHVSMVIILPPWLDDGLQQTVARLTPTTLQGVMAELSSGFYSMDKLNLKIPKFSVSGSLELNQPLAELNITKIFGPESDLSGFLDPAAPASDQINLNAAVHKSFIEVTEDGSEAAAATALLGFRSARPLFHTEFKADHPFIFLIYDKQVETILFFGVYQYPPSP
jgi:serine protease inhibitor